jgi:hypothetical protein
MRDITEISGGGYDIVGDDDVGAAAASKGAAITPQAGLSGRGPRLVREAPNRVMRRQFAPVPNTVVPAGGSTVVAVRPQRIFRADRLVLNSTTVPSFVTISEINVGAQPQLVNQGNIPISVFAANAFDTYLRGDTATPGIDITIRLDNSGGAPETVGGTFIGESVET